MRSCPYCETGSSNAFWNGSQLTYGDGDGQVWVEGRDHAGPHTPLSVGRAVTMDGRAEDALGDQESTESSDYELNETSTFQRAKLFQRPLSVTTGIVPTSPNTSPID
ncbi:MAG: hypothetical protein C5B58_07235 [Acidobacteria bacterium]|nr:MAG: hypothetical protein C5B58_07235 [Acidobacteriota bacterium]